MTTEIPFFSIVIPTFDRPTRLGECLGSLRALTYPRARWEAIVVNDGGHHSWESVPAVADLPIRRVEADHLGPASARNAGARVARGTHLVFTDDDCRVFPDWLEQIAAGFASGPWDALGGKCLPYLAERLPERTHEYLVDFLYQYMRLQNGDPYLLLSNNSAYRRSVFEALGGFDASFPRAAAEDRDLSHRLIAKGHRQTYWPLARVWHYHPVTWWGYIRLQFTYGLGDAGFRRALKRRGLPRRIGQRGGLLFPLALARQLWQDRAPAKMWLLLGLSQLSHQLGSAWGATLA